MNKILLLLLTVFAFNLSGFTMLNQRSHPELDWKQLETENIIIVYHQPFRETALQTAAIAEETFNKLSKSYKIKLNKKIKIYISDQDDIVNGYTFLTDHIVLWISQNDFIHIFTGKEKWIRKVVSHEMSHFFMYSKIGSWLDNFYPYSAITFPRDFSEGYAMYYSGEEWGYGREDAELRKGVFANDLSLESSRGYFYTTGFSMIKYLSSLYGEDKLQQLLEQKDKYGLYDFEEAFKEVYKEDLIDFKDRWRRYIYTYYYGEAYNMKDKISATDSCSSYSINGLSTIKSDWFRIDKAVVKGENVLLYGKKNKNQHYFDLYYGKLNGDSLKLKKLSLDDKRELLKTDRIIDLDLSHNGKFVTYSKYSRAEFGSIRKKIYTIKTNTGEQDFRQKGNHSVITNGGDIYFHKYDRGGSRILLNDNSGNTVEVLRFDDDTQIGNLVLNDDETKLAYSKFDSNSEFFIDIYDLKQKKIVRSLKTAFIARKMIWLGGNLSFSVESAKDFRTGFSLLNIKSGKLEEYETPAFNIEPIAVLNREPELELLTFGAVNRKDSPLGIVKLIRIKESGEKLTQKKLPANHYTKWISTEYKNKISSEVENPEIISEKGYNSFMNLTLLAALPIPFDDGMAITTIAMDPLGKHTITVAGYSSYDLDMDEAWYTAGYVNRSFYPVVSLNYAQFKWFAGMENEKVYYQDLKKLMVDIKFPVDYIKKPFWFLNYSFAFEYTDAEMTDNSLDAPTLFEDGNGMSLGAKVSGGFDLPYLNHLFHPIKKVELAYQIFGAEKKIGMDHSFNHHLFNIKLGYAPLYDFSGIDYFTLVSNSRYEWQNGKYFVQDQPGIDKYENIPVEGLISNKTFVRGNQETLNGDQLFTSNSELWLKLPEAHLDKLEFFFPQILKPNYLGVAAFLDYSSLKTDGFSKEIKSFGWEVKAVINLLGIPTVHRLGEAYDLKTKDKLGIYYQAAIPLAL